MQLQNRFLNFYYETFRLLILGAEQISDPELSVAKESSKFLIDLAESEQDIFFAEPIVSKMKSLAASSQEIVRMRQAWIAKSDPRISQA